MTKTRLALAAALPLLTAGALLTGDATALGDDAVLDPAPDVTETEAIVRAYLLEHPEVVIEAIERYQAREAMAAEVAAEDAVATYLPRLSAGEAGVALGASEAEAEVIVVEFFDYHCGYCRQAADFVLALSEREGVRVVFQDLPILRDESRTAALAGLAAHDRGEYARVHRALMNTKGALDDDAIRRAAKKAGASRATLAALGAPGPAHEAKLALSEEVAVALGLQGTPAFLVAAPGGGAVRIVPGYAPGAIEEAIEAVRG